jgi:hypothetical protein
MEGGNIFMDTFADMLSGQERMCEPSHTIKTVFPWKAGGREVLPGLLIHTCSNMSSGKLFCDNLFF